MYLFLFLNRQCVLKDFFLCDWHIRKTQIISQDMKKKINRVADTALKIFLVFFLKVCLLESSLFVKIGILKFCKIDLKIVG